MCIDALIGFLRHLLLYHVDLKIYLFVLFRSAVSLTKRCLRNVNDEKICMNILNTIIQEGKRNREKWQMIGLTMWKSNFQALQHRNRPFTSFVRSFVCTAFYMPFFLYILSFFFSEAKICQTFLITCKSFCRVITIIQYAHESLNLRNVSFIQNSLCKTQFWADSRVPHIILKWLLNRHLPVIYTHAHTHTYIHPLLNRNIFSKVFSVCQTSNDEKNKIKFV